MQRGHHLGPSSSFRLLVSERLEEVSLVSVAAANHPFASIGQRIPRRELAKHVQLVLTDWSDLIGGRDFGVVSPTTWRLADPSTKYAFIRDCVGRGGMPLHMVEKDIANGSLIVLDVDDMPRGGFMLNMGPTTIHRSRRGLPADGLSTT